MTDAFILVSSSVQHLLKSVSLYEANRPGFKGQTDKWQINRHIKERIDRLRQIQRDSWKYICQQKDRQTETDRWTYTVDVPEDRFRETRVRQVGKQRDR